MKYIVRDFKENDYDFVLNVWNQTNMGGAHRGDNLAAITNTLAHGGKLFVLEDLESQKVIGTSWITNDFRRLYLHHFGIIPDFQGKGLSHQLMKASILYAKSKGMQIKLEVHKDNNIAHALYSQYKFTYLGDYEVLIIRDVTTIDL